MLPTRLPTIFSSSVEMPRTNGSTPAMTLCLTMKILLRLASAQCGLPSLSTMETFYERLRNPLI
jgi:hypothetical protein